MSGAAAAAAVAIVEAYFKDYLVCCEYLKLDPTLDYNGSVVRARVEELTKALEGQDEKLRRKTERRLRWFLRNYKMLTGRWYGFPKRCIKLIKKEKLKIHEGTVEEDYSDFTLTQTNYDFFATIEKKNVIIGLIIGVGILLLAATAGLMIGLM